MTAVLVAAAVALVATALRPHRTRALVPDAPTSLPADLATVLDTAAREVRTGSSTSAAVQHALRGHPGAADALADTATGRPPTPDWPVLLHALRRAERVGHQAAAVFDQAAATLRERHALQAEQRAHTTQARLSARVLTAVPVGFAALTAWSSPDVRNVYASAWGIALLAAGAALNLLGWSWMRVIIGRAA
jgi:Flp pilus assembly protein TadB